LNEFHPNELDPFLLFDARDSMIGTLENPTLDLDPSKPDTLNVITATRAGTATFTDVNGNIATAPANTVRVDHVDGVPMILVEPSATNLITYSEDFSQSFWTKNDITLSSGFSAPDGSMNASKLVADSANSSIFNAFTVASGTTYSLSFYLKTISGSLETTIGLGSPGFPQNEGEGGRYKNITVTDEWQRFTLTSTADASADTGISFGGFNGFSTGEEVYIWGAQLETGVATSYIPTSGSTAQRAADDLVISGSDFTDAYNQSEGTIYFEGTSNGISDPRLFEFSDGTASNIIKSDINDGSNFRASVIDGSSVIVSEQSSFTGASSLFRAALSFKVNDFEGNLNGVSLINETPASLPTVNQFHVGSNYDGNSKHLNGHIKRLIYWPYHSDSL
jgi:hypothetical protein